MIQLYFRALEHIDAVKGQAFNIGGGLENSLSLLELFSLLEELINLVKPLRFRRIAPRKSDQAVFVADNRKIENLLGWRPKVGSTAGIRQMIEWSRNFGLG